MTFSSRVLSNDRCVDLLLHYPEIFINTFAALLKQCLRCFTCNSKADCSSKNFFSCLLPGSQLLDLLLHCFKVSPNIPKINFSFRLFPSNQLSHLLLHRSKVSPIFLAALPKQYLLSNYIVLHAVPRLVSDQKWLFRSVLFQEISFLVYCYIVLRFPIIFLGSLPKQCLLFN